MKYEEIIGIRLLPSPP